VVDAGVDPVDGRGLEAEMDSLLSRLADDLSELAMIKLLPRAKELYEKLHPETKHGGNRERDARSATWPSFADFVASRTGISKRTVYNRLEKSERLATLDSVAEDQCYGSGIANQLGLLIRIAQIPEGAFQRNPSANGVIRTVARAPRFDGCQSRRRRRGRHARSVGLRLKDARCYRSGTNLG